MSTIVNLDGEWDFLWDTDATGLESRWYATYPEDVQKVNVPHVWEKAFAKPGSHVGYYFKRFNVDASENAKRIFLKFSRISTYATIWLNGKLLSEHFGAYTPLEIDTSKAIKIGEENILCVRVSSADTGGRIDFGRTDDVQGGSDRFIPHNELPVGLPWQQYPFAGICGSVQLVMGNRAMMVALQVTPDPDQERAQLEIAFNNPRNYQAKLRILIGNPDGEVGEMIKEIKLEKENSQIKLQLGFKECLLWSPEKPRLYTVEVHLEKSYPLTCRFGFRKFDCVKGDFYFNDRIVKLQGLRYSQHFSEGGLYHSDPAKLRADFQRIKACGFQVIRSGGAPLPPVALDICDELGLMVFQELPIHTQKSSPRGLERVRGLIEAIVEEGRSHACIVAWVLGAENGTLMLENGTKLLKLVDQFDKSRPVISNLNCVMIDNEQTFKKDTGKVMGVTNDRILLYPSHRMHLRMNPAKSLTEFLARYCEKDNDELEVPDLTLGDAQFQEEYSTFAQETNGKVLVTLRNHSLFHELGTAAQQLSGPRSLRNVKALQALHKQIAQFIDNGHGAGVWENATDFKKQANTLALKSKIDHIMALQGNPQVSGFFLDQWADYGTDLSGLVTEARTEKNLESFTKEITTGTRLLVNGLERACTPKQEIEFNLSLLNQARHEDVEIHIRIDESKGKNVTTLKKKAKGQTSLTPLGAFQIQAPSKVGTYKFEIDLLAHGQVVSTLTDTIVVFEAVNTKQAMKSVCFLDEAESSSDAIRAISGKESIIFTTSISSWNETILAKLAEATSNGKTLLISDMNNEDIEAFNACTSFAYTLEGHYTTGATETSIHYIPKDSPLQSVFGERMVLDSVCASIMPSMSLSEVDGARVLARSVTLENGELKHGMDVQVLPYGKGKLVFSQFNLLDNLETNPLADQLFSALVHLG